MDLSKRLRYTRRRFIFASGSVGILALSGCAIQSGRLRTHAPHDVTRRVELTDTPFFPDEAYYCGPAALATVLTAAGFATRTEKVSDQVFVPERKGSLQIEMLAAARRGGAVATVLPGELEALIRELAGGNPIVVLQNLGLSWAPSWHYAVLVGYDLDAEAFFLRSGPMKRQELSFRTFEHTWKRSNHWAFVALPPDQLPVTAREVDVTRALVAFERSAAPEIAARAYATALDRWPDNLVLRMGLGNSLHAAGDLAGSEAAFKAATRHDSAAAWNNLALVRLQRGRHNAALEAALRAHALDPSDENIRATLRRIENEHRT